MPVRKVSGKKKIIKLRNEYRKIKFVNNYYIEKTNLDIYLGKEILQNNTKTCFKKCFV